MLQHGPITHTENPLSSPPRSPLQELCARLSLLEDSAVRVAAGQHPGAAPGLPRLPGAGRPAAGSFPGPARGSGVDGRALHLPAGPLPQHVRHRLQRRPLWPEDGALLQC